MKEANAFIYKVTWKEIHFCGETFYTREFYERNEAQDFLRNLRQKMIVPANDNIHLPLYRVCAAYGVRKAVPATAESREYTSVPAGTIEYMN